MELASIEKLVEKYKNADTTLEEEMILSNYFTGEFVAPHLQEYVSIFTYFSVIKNETLKKNIQLEHKKPNKKYIKSMFVAASLIVLLGIVYIAKYEYDRFQAEKQFAQITEGLKLLSSHLKKGEEALANLYVYEKNQSTR